MKRQNLERNRADGAKTNKELRQYRLSLWLKAVDVILCGLILLLFAVFTWYGRTGNGPVSEDIRSFGFFIYFTAALTIAILLIFWNVATEIGRGNSFSLENVNHFRHMGICGGIISAGYFARLLYILVSEKSTAFRTGYCLSMVIVGLLFLSVCFILSSLIRNAYEMKQENDLTI